MQSSTSFHKPVAPPPAHIRAHSGATRRTAWAARRPVEHEGAAAATVAPDLGSPCQGGGLGWLGAPRGQHTHLDAWDGVGWDGVGEGGGGQRRIAGLVSAPPVTLTPTVHCHLQCRPPLQTTCRVINCTAPSPGAALPPRSNTQTALQARQRTPQHRKNSAPATHPDTHPMWHHTQRPPYSPRARPPPLTQATTIHTLGAVHTRSVCGAYAGAHGADGQQGCWGGGAGWRGHGGLHLSGLGPLGLPGGGVVVVGLCKRKRGGGGASKV
jgi:hypothetical protein